MLKQILILLFPVFSFAQAWVQLSDFTSTRRDDGIAVVIGENAYVGTGADQFGYANDFRKFDLTTFQWSTLTSMPNGTDRQYACGFGNDTCLFVTCGLNNNGALSDTYRYSFAQQTWSQQASKPNAGLMSAACFQFGNKIILAGGKGNNDVINHEVWEYDITNNQWQKKNNFPFSPIWRSAYTTLNDFGYMLGGVDSLSRFSDKLYRYFPASDQWLLIDSLPVIRGRAYQAMQGINNRLFVFGGFDSLNLYYNDAYIYHEQNNQWIPAPAMPAAARKGGMSFGYKNNFFYTCGILANGSRQYETWMTDVPTGLHEISNSDHWKIFPNPCRDNISITSPQDETVKISIISLQGALLKEFSFDQTPININLFDFEKGFYILNLQQEDGTNYYRKILVE